MTTNDAASLADAQAKAAEVAFERLSVLGPVAWLYARTPDRRFLFLADLDWAVMPPVVLDQCRLFMQGKMPFAFITWAFVSDEVHQRLIQGHGKLAPHEWKSGEHAWLIDVAAPFGGDIEMLDELYQLKFTGLPFVNYLTVNPATQKVEVRKLTPKPKAATETGVGNAADQLH